MTVFRVDTDRDEATVVKKLKQHDDVVKATKEWNKAFGKFRGMLEKDGKRVVSLSRQVYRISNAKLKEMKKDEKASPDDIAALLDLRKSSYDLTMSLKKLGVR